MQVNPDDFQDYLDQATFDSCGDKFEQKYGHYVADTFPNCERLWRLFVVPMTQRVNKYPEWNCEGIYPREGTPPVLQDIASAHYSMFLNLTFAHLHLEDQYPYSHEDIYIHLASACELADRVLGMWHLTCLKCQEKQSEAFSRLDLDEVLARIKRKFEDYEDPVKYYLNHRRTQSIYFLPSENDLVHECLEVLEYEGNYEAVRNAIKAYRNRIVHDVRIGRYLDTGEGTYLVPKVKKISDYKTWCAVAEIANEPKVIKRDFTDFNSQAEEQIRLLETTLHDLWNVLIENFSDEFYSDARDDLRQMFDIEFSDKPRFNKPLQISREEHGPLKPSEEIDIRISGAYIGPGSATRTSDLSERRETGSGGADPFSHRRDWESTESENEEEGK